MSEAQKLRKVAYDIEVACDEIDMLGECVMWHPTEQVLYWVDTRRPALRRLNRDGSTMTWPMPTNIGSFVFKRDGTFVVALKSGFHHFNPVTNELTFIVDPEPECPENRLNDGRCDRAGRFWCGSRDQGNDEAGGSLYRLDPDLSVHKMDTGFIVANGMAFPPGDDKLIFGCTRQETMWQYDLDMETGDLTNKRPYIQTATFPWRVDGACCDADGYYWAALVGDSSIGRFDKNGNIVACIRLPVTHPTMCNFGGPDLDVLYVVTSTVLVPEENRASQPLAGKVLAIRNLGVKGIAEPFFGERA